MQHKQTNCYHFNAEQTKSFEIILCFHMSFFISLQDLECKSKSRTFINSNVTKCKNFNTSESSSCTKTTLMI